MAFLETTSLTSSRPIWMESRKDDLMADANLTELLSGDCPQSVEQLEDVLSTPTIAVVEMFSRLEGHLLLVGAAGKMGPTMVRMAHRAIAESGSKMRLTAVSRFSDPSVRDRMHEWGIETIACDLLQPSQVAALPDCTHLINLSGFKFGAAVNPALTWATNCDIPATLCRRFSASKIVAFSTGNVYAMVAPATGGSLESDSLEPVGEYAMAALGRERMFQYHCEQLQIPTLLVRLNYATELRYGVLVDIATSVLHDQSIDVTTGFVNVIWQGDANAMTLRCLELATVPARPINLTGPVGLSVRSVAQEIASLVDVALEVTGTERGEALLSQAAHNYELLGAPQMDLETMLRWTVQWLQQGGESLGKPTKFNAADGKF